MQIDFSSDSKRATDGSSVASAFWHGVGSGQEAIDLLQEDQNYDLAILDYQMPDIDGISLAGEIQKIQGAERIPLIMLSSLGSIKADKGLMKRFAGTASQTNR